MSSRTYLSATVVAMSLLASVSLASAQSGIAAGSDSITGAPTAPMPSASDRGAPPVSATTGMSGGASQAGAPGVTSPGRIGTGASPSGLAGDNPSAPGFPGKVGR